MVNLWRLAALNPRLSNVELQSLYDKIFEFHVKVIEAVTEKKNREAKKAAMKRRRNNLPGSKDTSNSAGQSLDKEIWIFTGFKTAIEACSRVNWDDCSVPGVTAGHRQLSSHATNRTDFPRRESIEQTQSLDSLPSLSTGGSVQPACSTGKLASPPSSEKTESQRKKLKFSPPEESHVDSNKSSAKDRRSGTPVPAKSSIGI